MSIRPGRAKGPWVGLAGSSGGLSASDIKQGYDSYIHTLTGGELEFNAGVAHLWDTFLYEHPFWNSTDVIQSGDWQRSGALLALEGIASTNAYDRFRYHASGDCDYIMHINLNGASSGGFYLLDSTNAADYVRISIEGTTVKAWDRTNLEASADAGTSTLYLRISMRGESCFYYYKVNFDDEWTLLHQQTTAFATIGPVYDAAIDSATNARIMEVFFFDNMFPMGTAAKHPKSYIVSTGSNYAPDCRFANVFDITLTGNITLLNPLYPMRDMLLLLRIRQDGIGGRTLAFDTKYDFSTDLPSPTISTAASARDYLGFIYNKAGDTWDYISEIKGF